MRKVVQRLVEQHITQAAADDHAEHAIEQHVVDVARMPAGEKVLPRADLAQHDKEHEADEIHQPVPANGDRPKVQSDGIELRMNEHREKRASPALESFARIDRLYETG